VNSDGQCVSLLDAECWSPLIDVATSYARPIMLHASEAPGHRYRGKGTATPEKLVEWLGNAQDIDVVLAHWGGGLPFYELMPEVRRLTRRVFYDSAATTYLYAFDVFPRVIDLVGPDRVLFGTDFPLLKQARFLARTRERLRHQEESALVLAENADRVYRLDGKGQIG
jgi:predicted TIM-barrel fold metal-dependent hydrolase